MTAPREAEGDCFEVALDLLERLNLAGLDDVQLCHGLPVERGAGSTGRRIWRAWIEVGAQSGYGVTVLDLGPGGAGTPSRQEFYELGYLDDETVWRFSAEDAAAEQLARGHSGPWVDGWQGLEEV